MSGKKALQLASVASMIDQFTLPNILILQSLGYQVDVVADFTHTGTITNERAEALKKRLEGMGVTVFDVAIPRSLDPAGITRAYRKVKQLISTRNYDLIHCHSPIGGAICRAAARGERKKGTRVIYTAHGFHFYNGAPMINWMIYYPVEKWLSRYTDVLITINTEDYQRAREKLVASEVVYVPGIGVNTRKFVHDDACREQIRREFGLGEGDILFLSVGELNDNKNHKAVIDALARMKASDVLPDNLYYVIVGKGEREKDLVALIQNSGLKGNVILAGFRSDVAAFYSASDVFIFPSYREGLSVSLMEAMSSGLAVVCSRIRGNTDLLDEGKGGFFFEPQSVDSIVASILKVLKADHREMGLYNIGKVQSFDLERVNKIMTDLYMGQTGA